jgi:hypothetical protein
MMTMTVPESDDGNELLLQLTLLLMRILVNSDDRQNTRFRSSQVEILVNIISRAEIRFAMANVSR